MTDPVLDLSAAQTLIEGLMTATVVVYRDVAARRGQVFDRTTGEYVDVDPPVPVYTGTALLSAPSVESSGRSLAGVTDEEPGVHYGLRLPLAAPALQPQDWLTVTASRKPQLMGLWFQLDDETTVGELSVAQRGRMLQVDAPPWAVDLDDWLFSG